MRNLKSETIEYTNKTIWHSNPASDLYGHFTIVAQPRSRRFKMSHPSVFSRRSRSVGSLATAVSFAKEKHHAPKTLQLGSEQIRYRRAPVIALPERPSNYLPEALAMSTGGRSAPASH